MNAQFYWLGLCCFGFFMLSACQTEEPGLTGIPTSALPSAAVSASAAPASPDPSSSSGELSAFVMRLQAHFRVQSVDDSHQLILKEVITKFQSDLANGQTEDYYESPGFSIKLLAGSEGSYFHTAETLARVTSLLEGYAQALVIYPDQSFDVYKGQLSNGAFYFNGASTLPANNTTYLVALNQELETQVLSGSLEPFQIQNLTEASASPEPSPTPSSLPTVTPTATPTPLPSPSVLNFALRPPPLMALLERERLQREAYSAGVNQQRPVPPPPPENRAGRFPPPNQAPPRPPEAMSPAPDGSRPPDGNRPPPPPGQGQPPAPRGAEQAPRSGNPPPGAGQPGARQAS